MRIIVYRKSRMKNEERGTGNGFLIPRSPFFILPFVFLCVSVPDVRAVIGPPVSDVRSIPRNDLVQIQHRPRHRGPRRQLGRVDVLRRGAGAGGQQLRRRRLVRGELFRVPGVQLGQHLRPRRRSAGRDTASRSAQRRPLLRRAAALLHDPLGEDARRLDEVGSFSSTSACWGMFERIRSTAHSSRLGASKASRLGCRNVRCQ